MNNAKPRSHPGPVRLLKLFVPAIFVLAALFQHSSQGSYADDQPQAGPNNEAGISSALKRLSTVGNKDTESDASALHAYSTLGLASEQNPHQRVDGFYARQDIPLDEEVKRSLGADLIQRDVEDCRKTGKSNDQCLKEAVDKMKALGSKPEILDRLVASMEKAPLEMLRARKPLSVSPEPEWPVAKPERGPTGGGTGETTKPATPTSLTLKGHRNKVNQGKFSPDCLILATTGEDKTVRLWNTQTGELLKTLEGYGTAEVVFSADGRTGASDYQAERVAAIKVWEVQTGALKQTLNRQIGSIALSPDGNTVATLTIDNGIKGISLWDVQSGALRLPMLTQEQFRYPYSVRDFVFSPDGNLLVVGTGRQSQSGEVVLIDASTGATKSMLSGHTNIVQRVAISPDGLTLASVSLDATVRLWDLKTGQIKQTLRGDTPPLSALFSFDGKMLAAGVPSAVMMWDAQSGSEKPSVEGSWSIAISFSPDAKTILVATTDGNDVVLKRFPVS
jgi:WD40 domain-containing protein